MPLSLLRAVLLKGKGTISSCYFKLTPTYAGQTLITGAG